MQSKNQDYRSQMQAGPMIKFVIRSERKEATALLREEIRSMEGIEKR